MNKNIYFKNIPIYRNLYIVETLFEHNNTPIVFICIDDNDNLFVCLCTDAMFHYSCMIAKTSIDVILKLIRDQITIYKVFEDCPHDIIIVDYINKNFQYSVKSFNEIPVEDLPCDDEFLELESTKKNRIKNNLYRLKPLKSLHN